MNWLYSFIAAFALIFTMPIINNIEGVKAIGQDIKNAVVKEISDYELKNQLARFINFGNGGDASQEQLSESELQEKEKYLRIKEERFSKSVSPETMLKLSTEVYVGNIQDICYYNMDVKERQVDGWTCIKKFPQDFIGTRRTDSGTTIALWVNNYDANTYAMAIAGTDEFGDMLQYIPMETSETRATQQLEVAKFIKDIPEYVESPIKKFYITGHSLGGFLATSAGTDMLDASIASSKKQSTHALNSVSDLGTSLTKDNVYVYSYSAPGLLQEIPDNIPSVLKSLLQVGNEIPSWAKEKLANNNKNEYDRQVFQYVNSLDMVADISNVKKIKYFPYKDAISEWKFQHVGTVYACTQRVTLAEELAFKKRFSVEKGIVKSALSRGAILLNLQYHLPATYMKGFTKNNFKQI